MGEAFVVQNIFVFVLFMLATDVRVCEKKNIGVQP